MSILYHDWDTGDDTLGNGSSSAPYKTFIKAHTEALDGDEIRVAKTEVRVHVLDATWTNNSTQVLTSSSTIGIISVGDYISKPTGGGNGNKETCYYVLAQSGSEITLESPYYGTSETVSSIRAITPFEIAPGSTSVPDLNPCLISKAIDYSGGWNLTTETRDGETWYKVPDGGSGSSYPALNVSALASASYLNVVWGQRGTYVSGTIHHCTCVRGRYTTLRLYDGANVQNCVSNSTAQLGNYFACEINGKPSRFHDNLFLAREQGVSITSDSAYADLDESENINYVRNCTIGIRLAAKTKLGKFIISGCSIRGVQAYSRGTIMIGWEIDNCAEGVYFRGVTSGQSFIHRCKFTNCNTQPSSAAVKYFFSGQHLISENEFENNTVDIEETQYTKDVVAIGNDHKNAGIAYLKNIDSGITVIKKCTIDNPLVALDYPVSVEANINPLYIVEDSFGGISGSFYAHGTLARNNSVLSPVTSTPTMKFSYSTSIIKNYSDYKIACCYVGESQGKTVKIYYKTDNALWAGEITPKIKLNGITIIEETTITTIDTDWILLEIEVDGSLITEQGELSFEINVSSNTYSIFFGDFSAEDL